MSQAYRVWSVPQSPLRIEYSAELLRQAQREGAGDKRGYLYGRRSDTQIRLLAARRKGHSRDPRLAGLERVGAFAVRSHGEVFLTEKDLEFLEREDAALTLVLAGPKGGFFVRENDGSMQSIRSHREFFMPSLVPRQSASQTRSTFRRALNAIGIAACLILSVAAVLYAEPKAALTLTLHEEAGQLIAAWNTGVRGTLQIRDGVRNLQVPISTQETRTTYRPEGSDLEVILTTLDGMTREEHLHLTNLERVKPSRVQPVLDQIAKLQSEQDQLKTEAEVANRRLSELTRQLPH